MIKINIWLLHLQYNGLILTHCLMTVDSVLNKFKPFLKLNFLFFTFEPVLFLEFINWSLIIHQLQVKHGFKLVRICWKWQNLLIRVNLNLPIYSYDIIHHKRVFIFKKLICTISSFLIYKILFFSWKFLDAIFYLNTAKRQVIFHSFELLGYQLFLLEVLLLILPLFWLLFIQLWISLIILSSILSKKWSIIKCKHL